MRPTLPSPRSWPSYSCCARRMVRRALKPSLRAASCCSVEVVKGGAGLRRRCLRSIASTRNSPPPAAPAAARMARSTSRASVSLVKLNCSTLPPRYSSSFSGKDCSPCAPSPSMVQYSCARNAPISSSRSEEHTSELQSQSNLVCRLLLEKQQPEAQLDRLLIRTALGYPDT